MRLTLLQMQERAKKFKEDFKEASPNELDL